VQHLRECDANVTHASNGDRAVGQWPMQPSVAASSIEGKTPRAVHGDGSPPTLSASSGNPATWAVCVRTSAMSWGVVPTSSAVTYCPFAAAAWYPFLPFTMPKHQRTLKAVSGSTTPMAISSYAPVS